MTPDPWTNLVLILCALSWSMIGASFWADFRQESPSQGWVTFLVCFGGPAVWGLAVYHGWLYLRHCALARFGVAHYSCGCHRHQ